MRVEPAVTCRAPHVALRFSPDGRVHACCVNEQYELGRIGERSLHAIWGGEEIRRLREALDAADFSLGCQDCGVLYAVGERLQTHAEQFDRFPAPSRASSWPRRMEFALSNTCNLQCVQCSGELSSAIRAHREHRPPLRSPYGDAFFTEIREFLPHVEVAVFIGGEPFLSRECRRIWDLLIEVDHRPEVHVTTNATVWDDRVEHYLEALEMNVAFSLDGVTAEVNDRIRVGSDFAAVLAVRDRLREVTGRYGGTLGWNHCLMMQNWHELPAVLREGDRLDVDVHVIPVVYPPAYSLLCLPRAELAPIVAGLEAEERHLELGRNRRAWDATMAHLRLRLSPTDHPVALRDHSFPGRDDDLLRDLESELAAWSGQAPLVIDTEDGVVQRVDGLSHWTAPLDPERWVGRPGPAILDELRERLGGLTDLDHSAAPGVRRATCVAGTNGNRRDLRLAIAEWHEGLARRTRTLIGAR